MVEPIRELTPTSAPTTPTAPAFSSTWLAKLARLVARRPGWILGIAISALLVLGFVASGAMSSFVLSRWEVPGTESVAAQDELTERFGTGTPNVILLVEATGGSVDDPSVEREAMAVSADLDDEPRVAEVWSYWSTGRDPSMRSDDAGSAVVLAHVAGDATSAREVIARLIPAYTIHGEAIEVRVAGGEAASTQISEQAALDFVRAELIILPLMFALLLIIYRRLSFALLTLGVGVFAVVSTLAGLRALTGVTEIASFAANITLVMGIGLGVDYSLFVISRFREALGAGRSVPDALAETLDTAGRTVIFSGLTVAAAMSMLFVLPYDFLRSFAWAGVLTVLAAGIGAIVVLPAALAVIGARMTRRGRTLPASKPIETGRWYRLGRRVMDRPLAWGGITLISLIALAAPAAGVQIGVPDDRVLPPGHSVRDTYDELRTGFSAEPNDALQVVNTGPAVAPQDIAEYATDLSTVDGIVQVNSPAGVFAGGTRIAPAPDRLDRADGQRLEAVPSRAALDAGVPTKLVHQVRSLDSPFSQQVVGGDPAELVDFRDALMERLPLVGALILMVTFVLLFLFSGSLLIPLKAVLLNMVSIAVMFAVLTVVFQNGMFANLLGFTPIGTLDPAFPILMFCVVYGLSMDYEVFMVSRIREEYDRTGDNRQAVLVGLQRSAPLITAAAVTLAVSFAVYASGEVMYLKMIGIGTAVAILLDATIIRGVLVPAAMRLGGRANWYLPPWLNRIFGRLRLRES
ncbi:MMPL family transporter [Nocardioides sp. NPDC087217]|uniref:MMPL family transporter n=1 Tax=Nocardioides sp. NPDC087217 TaxID=3364335 RepID=UPI00381D2821